MERGTILDKAKETINGARKDAYGNPEDSFSAISELWTAYTGINFTAHDVAMMMALLPLVRRTLTTWSPSRILMALTPLALGRL